VCLYCLEGVHEAGVEYKDTFTTLSLGPNGEDAYSYSIVFLCQEHRHMRSHFGQFLQRTAEILYLMQQRGQT
jgi:hypothetical protein